MHGSVGHRRRNNDSIYFVALTTYLLKMTQEVTSTLYTDDITACDNVTALILSPKLKLGQASVM